MRMIPHGGPDSFARDEEQLRDCIFVRPEGSNRQARELALSVALQALVYEEVNGEEERANAVDALF